MTIRLIVTDLDGTLLGADKRISRRNIRALTACRDRGIRIALASGRSARATGSVAAQAGLSDSLIISSNGARMDESSGGPILMEDCIEPDTAREAARRLIRAGIYVECYADGRIYMVNRTPLKNHCHRPGPTGGGDVFFEGEQAFMDEGVGRAYKLIVFSDDEAVLEESRRLLRDMPLSLSRSGEDNLEIMRAGAGKGRAVARYAFVRGVGRDEIMAFGDQTNDISMLDYSGWPVAMENAAAEVKARARLIAPSCDCSGVAQILEKYVLEGENR